MPTQINTLHFDFRLETVPTEMELKNNILKHIEEVTETTFEKVVASTGKKSQKVWMWETKEGDPKDMNLTIRTYDRKINSEKVILMAALEYPSEVEELCHKNCGMTLEELLEEEMKGVFNDAYVRWFPFLKRGIEDSPYLRTSDDRLVEYGFQKVLFSKQSPYQLIQIVKTVDHGNLLILDDYTNLAENDTIAYTHGVMNLPHEDYGDKEVLILGGGDGGIISELFKQEKKPKFVTMVDIDDMVMEACNEHMSSVCGKFLDKKTREGPNHKVIAGCAIKFLAEAKAAGRQFDYIFGDLTDVPVSTTARNNDIWDFLKNIISSGVGLLKPNTGKYMTHCNGKNVPSSISAYENMLKTLADGKVSFTRSERFVPSFYETWMYYQISRKE